MSAEVPRAKVGTRNPSANPCLQIFWSSAISKRSVQVESKERFCHVSFVTVNLGAVDLPREVYRHFFNMIQLVDQYRYLMFLGTGTYELRINGGWSGRDPKDHKVPYLTYSFSGSRVRSQMQCTQLVVRR